MNGRMMLMIRIANGRPGPLTDAHATLSVMLAEHTMEGQSFRRSYDLPLVRPHLPVFALTWTLMHDLGPGSPLHGFDARRLAAQDARIILTVAARDPALSAEVHDTRDYLPSSIRFGMRYADALITDAQGRSLVDLTRLSELESMVGLEPYPA
jgi:inward rectifier potassium channel